MSAMTKLEAALAYVESIRPENGFKSATHADLYRCSDILAAEVRRLQKLTQWQPMATAPRDGSLFMVSSSWDEHHVDCVRWSSTKGAFVMFDKYDSGRVVHVGFKFVWLPLPAAPESEVRK